MIFHVSLHSLGPAKVILVQVGQGVGQSGRCAHVPGARLQVREARHDDVDVQLSAVDGGFYEVGQVPARVLQRPVQPQPRVRRHLSDESSVH